MHDAISETLDRAIQSLEREFLGAQRGLLLGLELDTLQNSTLKLRANVPPPSPAVHARLTRRLGEVLEEELGVRFDVRILAARRRIDASKLEIQVDQSNRTAHLMFEALADGRAGMNPVFVYGPPGSGKSYLLQSFLRRAGDGVVTRNGREFHQAVARLLRGPGLTSFHRELLDARLFVLDEVHRLAGKRRAQRELVALIDEFLARSTQIVLLGRHHPRKIHNLSEPLQSRFLGGFTVEMGVPTKKTREHFLRMLGATRDSHPDLVRRALTGSPSFGDMLTQVDRAFDGQRIQAISMDEVVETILTRVAQRFGLTTEDLLEATTCRRLSTPRQVAVYVARGHGVSGAEMARRFGWRSASSATYAVKRVEQRMRADTKFRQTVEGLL